MKNHYPTIKAMFAIALAVLIKSSTAQTVEYLNANNVNAGIGVGGNLFSRFDSSQAELYSLLEYPKGSNKRTTYTTALWFSATDAGGNLHCAGQTFANRGHDFFDGPIVAHYTAAYDNFFKRVFKVTRNQITRHVGLGNSINPNLIDSAILFWPAKGNSFVNSAYGVAMENKLAPFIDVDGDQVYNPSQGDAPAICGEEAIFFVFNDARWPHKATDGAQLGVEVRGLAEVFTDYSFYGFDDPYPPRKRVINNTVFVSYEIENKSANTYVDFNVGLYDDVDLGCHSNDRVGCDTTRNLMLFYNDVSPEPDCNGVSGYGRQCISSGIKTLNQKLTSFGFPFGNVFLSDTVGSSCFKMKNVLNGLSSNGTPNIFDSVPTKYLFPGNPNDTSDLTEISSGQPAGDRRILGTNGPIALATGETRHFDYAFMASMDSTATKLTIVDTLKRDADLIQVFYDSIFVPCRSNKHLSLSINNADREFQVKLFPNPATSALNIIAALPLSALEVTDMLGRTIIKKRLETKFAQLDISALLPGAYILRINTTKKTAVKRFVKE